MFSAVLAHGRNGAFVVQVGVFCLGGVEGRSALFVTGDKLMGEGRGVVKQEAAVPKTGMAAVPVLANEMIGAVG